jgi:hypothetical protein
MEPRTEKTREKQVAEKSQNDPQKVEKGRFGRFQQKNIDAAMVGRTFGR